MIYGKLKLYYSIAIAVLVLGVGLCGGSWYIFQQMLMPDVDKEKVTLDEEIAKKEGQKATIEPLTNAIAKKTSELERLRRRIPASEDEFDGFIDKLLKLRSLHFIHSISAEVFRQTGKRKVELPPGIKDATFNLKIVGEHNNVLQFLNSIELEERFVRVESVSMKRPKLTGKDAELDMGQVELSINTVVYSYTKGLQSTEGGQKAAVVSSTPAPQ